MDEFLRLLAEFGADEAVLELATRWANRDQEGIVPLTDEELVTLRAAIEALADEDEASAALLTEAVAANGTVVEEQTARAAAADAEDAAAETARQALRGETAEGEPGEGDEPAEGDEADPPAEPAEGDEPAEGEGEGGEGEGAEGAEGRQAVTASGGAPAARRRPRAPRSHEPQAGSQAEARIELLHGRASGANPTLHDVDVALFDRARAFRGTRSRTEGGENVRVATIHGVYPENRRLSMEASGRVNGQRVADALAEVQMQTQALVAAGGLCAPLTPYYGVEVYGNDRRPVRAALPGFQAARGGIISVDPPVLTGWPSDELIVWTAANDGAEDPDPAEKPCVRIDCGAPRSTEIDALPLCLTFGNFASRTFAEYERAWSRIAMIAYARFAEQNLLAKLQAGSTAITAQTVDQSIALDMLARVNMAATGFRQRHRMDEAFPFRVILPNILVRMIQDDISQRMPGDSFPTLTVTQQLIETWFAARNILVTWTPDYPGTMLGVQAQGDLNEYPNTVRVILYPEGTFLFLDGGELDLGVVRDSELNKTNDFQTFAESFEAVHKIGAESLTWTQAVCIRGSATGLLDPTELCAEAS